MRVILCAPRLVPLRQQAATILGMLVQQPGRVVTRDQIRDRLWGSDTVVEFDQGLNNCIRGIRTALQDDAQSPTYVETLPRRGYRFIAPVKTPSPPVPRVDTSSFCWWPRWTRRCSTMWPR